MLNFEGIPQEEVKIETLDIGIPTQELDISITGKEEDKNSNNEYVLEVQCLDEVDRDCLYDQLSAQGKKVKIKT